MQVDLNEDLTYRDFKKTNIIGMYEKLGASRLEVSYRKIDEEHSVKYGSILDTTMQSETCYGQCKVQS